MLLNTTDALLSTGAMFSVGFVLLFLIYYITSPLYTEYGDQKSRIYYSLINAFYFSLVLAILFLVLPWLSDSYGWLMSMAVGFAIILASTLLQVFAVTQLVKRGIIRMRQKTRGRRSK
jgi:MFS family permease